MGVMGTGVKDSKFANMDFEDYASFNQVNENNRFTIESIDTKSKQIRFQNGTVTDLSKLATVKVYISNPSMLYPFGDKIQAAVQNGYFDKRSFTIETIEKNKEGKPVFRITVTGKDPVKSTLTKESLFQTIYERRIYLTNPHVLKPLFDAYVPPADGRKHEVNPQFRQVVVDMLKHCTVTQHKEFPVKVESGDDDNTFIFYAKVSQDFKHKMNNLQDAENAEAVSDTFMSKIQITGLNTVKVECKSKSAQKALFTFEIPKPEGRKTFPLESAIAYIKSYYTIFMGLCGYVPQHNIQTYFTNLAPFTHEDYQGIRDYTMTSGATNRVCRGITHDNKEEQAGGLRNIRRCDSFFDKTLLNRPLTVFRGVGAGTSTSGRTTHLKGELEKQGKTFNNPIGFQVLDSAYLSTSINLTSAMYFAGHKVDKGIIFAIELPQYTRAAYTHNIAGWVEQFEITLDRCYDYTVQESLFQFKDSDGVEYNIVRAILNTHAPMSPIAYEPLLKVGKTRWDVLGKASFETELAESVLHEAYQILNSKGVDVQYQRDSKMKFVDSTDEFDVPAMIVARTKNADTETTTDIGFSLAPEGGILVRKIKTKSNAHARQDYKRAPGLHWNEYGLGYAFDGVTENQALRDNVDVGALNSCRFLPIQGDITAKTIAERIYRYLQCQKNIAMFPILDVARYFDLCMAQVITSEGYELQNTIRVERQVAPELEGDSQAGFVPCQYTINGDNDDHLVIRIKFEREKGTNKLLLHYAGRSDNKVLCETKKLSFSIFNNDSMIKTCMDILYEFEKKMSLSRARKVDMLIKYFCEQTGCVAVRDLSARGKEINGHYIKEGADGKIDLGTKGYNQAGNLTLLKSYKIWSVRRTDFFSILASKSNPNVFVLNATKVDNQTKQEVYNVTIMIDTSRTMAQNFIDLAEGLMGIKRQDISEVTVDETQFEGIL